MRKKGEADDESKNNRKGLVAGGGAVRPLIKQGPRFEVGLLEGGSVEATGMLEAPPKEASEDGGGWRRVQRGAAGRCGASGASVVDGWMDGWEVWTFGAVEARGCGMFLGRCLEARES